MKAPTTYLQTETLDLAFERRGTLGGTPVVLLHGFPYDVRSFDEVAGQLAQAGLDVVVPHLRGFGATRFRSRSTMRSGQQGALAADVRDMIDGLELERPIVAGFDWGGRAACAAAVLWPEKMGGLVAIGGYSVYNAVSMASEPDEPELESRDWHQWYFQLERGRAGLTTYRRELALQLWREWSPRWDFDNATFDATAASFDNPDFVDIVVHSYRVRYGLENEDPTYAALEAILQTRPPIDAPTIVIDPTEDAVMPPLSREEHEINFSRLVDYRRTPVGHNTPMEDPSAIVDAILDLAADGVRQRSLQDSTGQTD